VKAQINENGGPSLLPYVCLFMALSTFVPLALAMLVSLLGGTPPNVGTPVTVASAFASGLMFVHQQQRLPDSVEVKRLSLYSLLGGLASGVTTAIVLVWVTGGWEGVEAAMAEIKDVTQKLGAIVIFAVAFVSILLSYGVLRLAFGWGLRRVGSPLIKTKDAA